MLIHPLRLNVCCNNAVPWCWCESESVCKVCCEVQTCDHSEQSVLWTLLLVQVPWFRLPFCERVLFAFRCEPVRHVLLRVCGCGQHVFIRKERTPWTWLVSFLHSCGCVVQAVISASRNNFVLIFFAWVFSTFVLRAETRKERCEQFVVNIESTIMRQVYGSGAMLMQVRIKVRRRLGPCGCYIQSYVECCATR